MAEKILKNAYVSVGGTDLSNRVRSVTLNDLTELQDKTTMGCNTRARKAGLNDWNVSVEFLQDYAAGSVHATIKAAKGTSVALVVRPENAVAGAENPEQSGNIVIENYNPVAGAVGDLQTCTISGQADGDLSESVGA